MSARSIALQERRQRRRTRTAERAALARRAEGALVFVTRDGRGRIVNAR